MTKATQNLRLQQTVTIIGIVLFIVKAIAWYLTRSVAILTDALESTVNVAAALIGTYSLYVSAKPKDKDHPYGHGKAEFISALVEGTLISVAGVIIIYKAVKNFISPQPVEQLDFGIILVGATAVVNYILGAVCIRTGNKNQSPALISSGKHLQTDTWSTAGIIAGLLLLRFTGWWWIDGTIAIIFAGFILFTGFKIVRSSVSGIMDEADAALIDKMVQVLNSNRRENWVDLHNLRIIKYGGTLHLDCHLTVPWYLNVHEAHREIDALSALVKNEFGETLELFVHSDGCLDFSCAICSKQHCAERKHPFAKKVEWTMENIASNLKHQL
ncbi:MAG TPA: cation diffusion facilitator family transporter [Ferruginibacter sp.]|nr:cation diffusion facilitator family transporter [Ferruginibacter sp.]HMP21583.1 cation diffusion facilitator family transporter [Ferruginibacter sp.]